MAQQPNPYRQQPVRRKPVQLNLPGASVTPAAQPVDTYYRTNAIAPRQSNEMLQLAGALAPFSQSLGNYLSFEKDNMAKEATAQAEMDINEMSVEELKAVATMTPEELKANPQFQGNVASRPDYYIAAKLNAGKRLGDIAQQEIIKRHGELQGDLTDPTKEPDIAAAYAELREEMMGGFEGFYIQKGAAASLDPLIDNLRQKTTTARTKRIVDENIQNLQVGLSKAFEAAAVGGVVTPGERDMIMNVTKAQLETYKNVGGANPQDIIFTAFENTLFDLADEDPSGDSARALLQAATEGLHPNGGALAKPGTKNHKRLLELEEIIENKIEQGADKAWTEEARAQSKAQQEVVAIRIRHAGGEIDRAEAEEQTRTVMEAAGFTENQIKAEFLLHEDELKNERLEANPEEVERLNALGRRRDLSLEMIEGADITGAEKQSLYDKWIANKPEDEALRERANGLRLLNADIVDIGLADPKAYPERVRSELDRRRVVFENKFWDTYDPEDPELAAKRKQAVAEFKAENADLLRDTSMGQMTTAAAAMKPSRDAWKRTLTGTEGDDPSNSALNLAGNRIYRATLEKAVAHANATYKNREEIPGLIADYMDEQEPTMTQEYVVERAKLERQDVTASRSLSVGLAVDEDSLPGEEFLFEGTRTKKINERTRELFIEMQKRMKGDEGHNVQGAFREVQDLLGADIDLDREQLGSFIASGGRSYTKNGVTLTPAKPGSLNIAAGSFTIETAKKHIALIDMATGLDANELLAGNLPVGVSSTDLNLSLTRVFKDRSEYDIWYKQVTEADEADDLEAMKNSKAGQLMRKLGIPDLIGDVPSAAVFMNLQAQLLGD